MSKDTLPDAPEKGVSTTAFKTSKEAQLPKSKPHPRITTLAQTTLRKPTWTYFHLTLYSLPPSTDEIDAVTARTHLTTALQQFLGLTGAAITIDILKIGGREVWIRVPREDGAAVYAALGGWVGSSDGASVGWRVNGRDEWLVRLGAGDGMDLFGG